MISNKQSCASLLLVGTFALAVLSPPVLAAEPGEAHKDKEGGICTDPLAAKLEEKKNQRVKIKLESGQDLEGKVINVDGQAVTLSELSGMEFYDAVVRLDQVSAVMTRERK